MAEEFNTEGMLDMYLYENRQLLEQLEATMLEKKDDDKFDDVTIGEFFRVMHTIKGSSGIMMFDDITKIAHKLEDVFYYLRETQPDNVPQLELVDYIFKVADFISGEFDKIGNGDAPDGSSEQLIKQIEDFLVKIKSNMSESGVELPPENKYVEPEQFYIAPVAVQSSKYYYIIMNYRKDTDMVNIRAYTATYSLKEIAEELFYEPQDIVSDEKCGEIILAEGFKMFLQTKSSIEEVKSLIDGSGVESIDMHECTKEEFEHGFEIEPAKIIIDLDSDVETIENNQKIKDEAAKSKEPEPGDYVIKSKEPGKPKQLAKNTQAKPEQQSFISVNIKKMDELMDLIGEIVIAQSVVLQNQDLKVPGLNLSNFQKAAAQLTKFTSELQDVIMSMRMVSLTNTFQKMNRVVFDIYRKLGKQIDMQMIGADTEVDKNIIERISDPLMHLIRNSVDHGIETPEERVRKGKSERGTIVLEAKNEGGKVFISVRDDGNGLNASKLYNKAKKNGLLGDKLESDFTKKEMYQFITYPGFSTKEEVTEYSGRGVGMDVVVKNIQEVGGVLDIDSEEGNGSVMILKIPLTLAIINGIVMTVGNSTFVVETSAVKEIMSVKEENLIHEPNGEEFVMVRGECLPVVRLEERYGISNASTDIHSGIMIILEHEGQKLGMFVDKMLGEQEIVVKPIPSYIKKIKGLSGCTQLGDGRIALIIDTGGLF
ncbi:chemotaxis protein CheA [Anaerosporobacter sp.]|uniref:chemotaxis protein CheA n=1 Tax=Anaerosporobacter sp. TaxID=1872529 RepID=UPI00286EE2E9|nr:chemotaxis protein CheA [Anaerosporobacter sp.]